MNFDLYITQRRERVQQSLLTSLTDNNDVPSILFQAMRYSVCNGGKRFRPLLVYAVAESAGASIEHVDAIAVSVELIHAYSLIHDDLPAMDNADLRRGYPSCHKVYGDAIAILAGDALLPLAFATLIKSNYLLAHQKSELVLILSEAIGASGMVGGQVLDLTATGQNAAPETLFKLHRQKTGALLKACIHMSAIAANVSTHDLEKMLLLADKLGLLYQLQDDIFDVESETSTLGKTIGKDVELNKSTLPQLLGIDAVKQMLANLKQETLDLLADLNFIKPYLKELVLAIFKREY